MNVQDLLRHVNLPDLIAQHWGTEAIRGLNHAGGGVICDRRPGLEETHPSFSVYRNADIWRWKRHGGDGASGTAYDFLLECGYSPSQAWEELRRLSGLPSGDIQKPSQPNRVYAPPSMLALTQRKLTAYAPLTPAELGKARRLLAPLKGHDRAAQDLQGRGLWNWTGLEAGKLRAVYKSRDGRTLAHAGALALWLTGPNGRAWGLKVRNPGSREELRAAGIDRYAYRIARHGAPAWCSPHYGQGKGLLIVEGELNGAAAAMALEASGMALDVQGLGGSGGVPHLAGIAGKGVYLYADPDQAGRDCIARLGQLAQEAGAAEVRLLAPLAEGDFCELLGRLGAMAFSDVLVHSLETSTIYHTVLPCGGKSQPTVLPPHQTLRAGVVVRDDPEALGLKKYRQKMRRLGVSI